MRIPEEKMERIESEAVRIYRETGSARLADYYIVTEVLRIRLGREPTEAEVLRRLPPPNEEED